MSTGWCTVQGCPGRLHDVYFKFPKDEDLYKEWLRLVKSPKSKKPILHLLSSRVCSLHFTDNDYDKKVELEGLTLECLKPTAIPSIFPWTESWTLNKKKKKAEGVNEKKPPAGSQKKADATIADQTFGCPSCDFTTKNVRSWQNHRRNHEKAHRHWCAQCNYSTDSLEQLEVHISRDHDGSSTESSASPVPKRQTARRKAIKTESGSSRSSTDPDLPESDDFTSANISSGESASGSRSSSIDSGIHESASSMFSKASGTPSGDDINFSAALKGMKLDHSYVIKREVETTPIVLDICSSSDEEKEDEVIQSSETAVKKENEAGEGKEKERKIIWVVSEEADD